MALCVRRWPGRNRGTGTGGAVAGWRCNSGTRAGQRRGRTRVPAPLSVERTADPPRAVARALAGVVAADVVAAGVVAATGVDPARGTTFRPIAAGG